jgi:hypothetical protein
VTTPVVVQCGMTKATTRQPARLLYQGQPFRMARAALERTGRPWLVLSARHGLVHPEELLDPYEQPLRSVHDLARIIAAQDHPEHVESWCSGRYDKALRRAGIQVTNPLAGVGIGDRYTWWKGYAA